MWNNPLKYTDPSGNCVGFLVPYCQPILNFVTKIAQPVIKLGTKIANSPTAKKAVETTTKIQSNPFIQKVESGASSNNSVNIPNVTDAKLGNIVRDLYKGSGNFNRIGSGSTADAIRNEIKTGLPTKGKFHFQKGEEYIRAIEKWVENNPDAFKGDLEAANFLKDDIIDALQKK